VTQRSSLAAFLHFQAVCRSAAIPASGRAIDRSDGATARGGGRARTAARDRGMIGEAPRRHVVGFTDRFEEQWAEAGEPSDMLLVYADTPDFQTQVLIGLPTAENDGGPSRVQTHRQNRPAQGPKLLMGDAGEFRRRFPRPA
jgi:hypothetical protein